MAHDADFLAERTSTSGMVFAMLAGTALAVGASSLIDAADGWQDFLNTIREARTGPGPNCPGQWTVSGFGDGTVLICAGIGLCLLALAVVAAIHGQRWGIWGQTAAAITVVPVLILWLDCASVGQSSIGDCDGIGLGGAASAAINRAGWLFLAAVILCGVASAALRARRGMPWESW